MADWSQRHEMAAFERVAANPRTILAGRVALQFVDGRPLRPAHDVQSHRLVRIAAEAADLEIEIAGVQGITQCRRGLRRPFVTEHALVPGFAGEPIGFLSSRSSMLPEARIDAP